MERGRFCLILAIAPTGLRKSPLEDAGKWAGVDSAWEQEKLEARKMLINGADFHTSGARFVSCVFVLQDR